MERSGNLKKNVHIGNNNSSNSNSSDDYSSDSENSQQWTSATSEQPRVSNDGPDKSVDDDIEPNPGGLEHVGSVFSDPSSNHVSPDDSYLLATPDAAVMSGSHLVKDLPIITHCPGPALHSARGPSNSCQIEDTQSTRSFARSATSSKHGSNLEFPVLLMSLRERNPHVDRKFYPCSVFNSIITDESVTGQLKTACPNDDEQRIAMVARQILGKTEVRDQGSENGLEEENVTKTSCLRRIFVLLNTLDKTEAIKDFIASGLNDSSLPFRRDHRNDCALFSRSKPNTPIQFISDSWKPHEIEYFYANQWSTISPRFSKSKRHKSVHHYKLSKNDILPFVQVDGNALQNHHGGTADVSRVFIHDDHHTFGARKDFAGSFAVKSLRPFSPVAFKNEVDMLKKFSDDDAYPHLISLLATYEQHNHFHMVFDWAERNLKGYWEHVQPQPSATDRKTVLWVGEQCKGIARGIVDLHQYETFDRSQADQSPIVVFGHHGDIKEENILWFPGTEEPQGNPNRGILKLADFGLARFRSNNTRSLDAAKGLCATPSYRSPESDLNNLQGRSYDIWTLGILYLQMITWLLGGWPLLQDFTMKRKCPDPSWRYWETDTFFERNPTAEGTSKTLHIIKPVVTRFIEELHHNKSCTIFLHEFLDLIAEQMLIVEGSEKVRISATNLYAELKRMVKRCSEDDVYALTPSQWGKSQPCGHGRPAAVEPLSTQNLLKLESQEGPSC